MVTIHNHFIYGGVANFLPSLSLLALLGVRNLLVLGLSNESVLGVCCSLPVGSFVVTLMKYNVNDFIK
nr:unnamed protein product [Callosobruchus chinensis]